MDTEYAYALISQKNCLVMLMIGLLLPTIASAQDTQSLQSPAYVAKIFDFSKESIVFTGYEVYAQCNYPEYQDDTLWLYDRRTQELQKLVSLPVNMSSNAELYIEHALLSPDGQTIYALFLDTSYTYKPGLYRLTAQAYAPEVLVDDEEIFSLARTSLDFAISPDGRKFLVKTDLEMRGDLRVHLITVDGERVSVTRLDQVLELKTQGSYEDTITLDPFFSPSGEVSFKPDVVKKVNQPKALSVEYIDVIYDVSGDLVLFSGYRYVVPGGQGVPYAPEEGKPYNPNDALEYNKLLNLGVDRTQPRYFPDGKLWLFNEATGEVKGVFDKDKMSALGGVLSPDKKAVFALISGNNSVGIYRIDLSSLAYELLVTEASLNLYYINDHSLTFAPDGNLLFTAYPSSDAAPRLYKLNLSVVPEIQVTATDFLRTENAQSSATSTTPLAVDDLRKLSIAQLQDLEGAAFYPPESGPGLLEVQQTAFTLQLPSKVALSFEDLQIAGDEDLQYLKGWVLTPPFVGACLNP